MGDGPEIRIRVRVTAQIKISNGLVSVEAFACLWFVGVDAFALDFG